MFPVAGGGAGGTVEEAQALLVLQHWQEMPELGIQLVPEHVETRPLYHPRSPGLLQVRVLPYPTSPRNPKTPRTQISLTWAWTQAPGCPNLPWGLHASSCGWCPPSWHQSRTCLLEPCPLTLVLQDHSLTLCLQGSVLGLPIQPLSLSQTVVLISTFHCWPQGWWRAGRSLARPLQLALCPQGSLHMWIDIFPRDVPAPPPVDIKPRQPIR